MTDPEVNEPDTPTAATSGPGPRPGSAEADRLAVEHVPLVTHVVYETLARVPSYVDRNDLRSAGLLALVAAARSFDPERGVPFARYAMPRIRGAMVDELRSVDWASRSVRRRAREIEEARARLAATLGEFPDDEAVAAALGMTLDEVNRVDSEAARGTVLPLDAGAQQGLAEILPVREAGPEERAVHLERVRYLADAVEELPERMRLVVRGYFLEERPMAELAAELGVTESRVSQVRAEALALLRDALGEAFDPHLPKPHPNPAGVAARRRLAYTSAVAARYAARRTMPARRPHRGLESTA
ncbi:MULTISPECIES: FliA/WhiG family RNA polymerase sigma factor [unclassified Nocardioides]|uniref:sigma-70 family RNA polymerase sigma factor n=1 Tax=unclassified Nocardioides TaxID=2615069 RepID=UPI0000571394|nr:MULTISPECIES: FliA/WhiG family RNA polymerase sigma factor [unclassified Nocardioides]ABL79878.1 RNA polymerase, sigma 28 subunit, SigD/FliA/WhiG [Nocardioides sp. JS614]